MNEREPCLCEGWIRAYVGHRWKHPINFCPWCGTELKVKEELAYWEIGMPLTLTDGKESSWVAVRTKNKYAESFAKKIFGDRLICKVDESGDGMGRDE